MKKLIVLALIFVPLIASAHSHHYENHYHKTQTPQPSPTPAPTPKPTPTIVGPVPTPNPPQGTTIKAIDLDAQPLSQNFFTTAYNDGIRLFIVDGDNFGTCSPDSKDTQSDFGQALASGMVIGEYTRLPQCWADGLSAAGSFLSNLQFFAIDEEGAGDGLPASPAVQASWVSGIEAAGVRPIMYSYPDAWSQIMGNSTAYDTLPLWTPGPFSAFGGWSSAVATQDQYNVNLAGINIDTDTFNSSFLK